MGLVEFVRVVVVFAGLYSDLFPRKSDDRIGFDECGVYVRIMGRSAEYLRRFFEGWACSLASVSDEVGVVEIGLIPGLGALDVSMVVNDKWYGVHFRLHDSCVVIEVYYEIGEVGKTLICSRDGGDNRERVVSVLRAMAGETVAKVVGYAYDIAKIMYDNLTPQMKDLALLALFP